jgi:catalase (peroxidase I)
VTQIPLVLRIATTILVSDLLTLSIVGMLWNSTSTFRLGLMRGVACWQETLLGSVTSWKAPAPG